MANGRLCGAGVVLREVAALDVSGPIGNRQLAIGNLHVFADGDEFHLRGNDALLRVPELRDGVSGAGAKRTAALALEAGEFDEPVAARFSGSFGRFAGV